MKRMIVLCGLLTAFFLSYSAPVEFKNVVPEEGSSITSWNFTLKFDISKALADVADPTIQYGLAYNGSETYKNYASLYKGEASEENLLGRSMTTSLKFSSEDFKINGDEIKFSFDSSIPIIDGQEYTIHITNVFGLKKKNNVMLSNTKLDCTNSPIVLKFKGGKVGTRQFVLESSSVKNGETLESLREVTYKFAHPVNIDSNKKVSILEGSEVIASAQSQTLNEDKTLLTVDFGREVPLNDTHTYTLLLPQGIASHAEDSSLKNVDISVTVNGCWRYVIPVLKAETVKDSYGFPTKIVVTYDMPENCSLTVTDGNTDEAHFSKIVNGEKEEIYMIWGKRDSSGNTVSWDLTKLGYEVVYEPGTEYVFNITGNSVVFDNNKNWLKEYSVAPHEIRFTTPTAEELNLPPITLGSEKPKLGYFTDPKAPDFIDGGTYSSINIIEIQPARFNYGGKDSYVGMNEGAKAYIYDVTDGTRVLVKEASFGTMLHETMYERLSFYVIGVQSTFFKGHKYEIVIPAGTLKVSVNAIRNYTTNEEIVYTLYGDTPTDVVLESCNVADDSTLSELAACVWVFDGTYSFRNDTKGSLWATREGYGGAGEYYPLFAEFVAGKTYVTMNLADRQGQSVKFKDGIVYSLKLPEGVLSIPGDESITNREIVVNFKGKNPESNAPEFVNTTLTLADNESNEAHSLIVKTAKGYPAEIQLLPGENWNISDVSHEGKSLSAVNGVYVSEPLEGDSKIVASLAYGKEMKFDQSTGVYSIEDTKIRVYTENNQIVVAGLTEPTDINVYTVGGILIKSMRSEQGYDIVRITADPDEIYVVVINGQSAKIRL